MSMSVHCSVLEIHFGIALNNGVLLGKEHMLTPCPALHRHFCAWVGAIRLDSGKDYWGHSCSVDCTVLWLFLSSYQYICLFIIINHLDALISQIYISNETLHVSDSSYVHHQEFFTVHTAMVCHTGLLRACEQEHLLMLASCQQTCVTYAIALCTVKNSWWRTEKLSETRRVSFQK